MNDADACRFGLTALDRGVCWAAPRR